MRLLILGGTQFLGRAIAAHALATGHDVTCAARGVAGSVPAGARLILVDRNEPDGLAPLAGMKFDAVVDVTRHPGYVRRAVAALRRRVEHWTFVSTVSVYADNRTVGQKADTAPLQAPTAMDIELSTPETYGAAKVACEQVIREGAFICRAGLIVGPEDPTGRFTYWPTRLQRGGEVLVAGTPDDAVQFIDVRDLAKWIVFAAKSRLAGIYDGIGPSLSQGEFLAECAEAVGASCTYTLGRSSICGEPRHQALVWPALAADVGSIARLCGICHSRHLTSPRIWIEGASIVRNRPRHIALVTHRRRIDHRSHSRRRERSP